MFVGLLRSSDNSVDHDAMFSVEDVEQDPPVANSNAVKIAFKLLNSEGAGVLTQRQDRRIKTPEHLVRYTLQFTPSPWK